jgi:hypothetical protein
MKYSLFRERSVLWALVLLGVFAGCQKKAQGPHHFIKLRAEDKVTKALFDSAVAVLNARLQAGYDGDVTARAEGKDIVLEVAGRPNLDSLAVVILSKGGFGLYETFNSGEVVPAQGDASSSMGNQPAPEGAVLTYALAGDTTRIRKQYKEQNASLFNASFVWGMEDPYMHAFPLYALKRGSKGKPAISKSMIDKAQAAIDANGRPSITIQLKEDYINTWSEMTRNNVGRQIAIRFANQVLSAPQVASEIPGGNMEVSGNFTMLQVRLMAAIISAPDLIAALKITHIDTALFVPLRGYPTLKQQARYELVQGELLQLRPQIDSLFTLTETVQDLARYQMDGIYRKDLNAYVVERKATQAEVDEFIDNIEGILQGVKSTLRGEAADTDPATLKKLLEPNPAQ